MPNSILVYYIFSEKVSFILTGIIHVSKAFDTDLVHVNIHVISVAVSFLVSCTICDPSATIMMFGTSISLYTSSTVNSGSLYNPRVSSIFDH